MKLRLLITLAALAAGSARATDVGVSVSVGDSGFYGRIDVGDHPKPQVISPIPVVVQPAPAEVQVQRPPIYLRVPPGHARHWSKHCRRYNACGERVLFVDERWYSEVYVPSHQAQGGEPEHPDHGRGHGHGKGHKES